MTIRWRVIFVVAIGSALSSSASSAVREWTAPIQAEPVATAENAPQPAETPAAESGRLVALRPSDARGYLELAEEVLDSPDSPERVALTRELLVRAIEYGRIHDKRTAASAAHALASMSKRESDRRWLRSIASMLEPSSDDGTPTRRERAEASRVASVRAALLLTQLRVGAGIEARESLKAPGVREALELHERELSARGDINVQDLESEAKKWPCTDCANSGIVAPAKGQRGSAKICPVCAGHPGMKLSAADLGAQLRLQRRLRGEQTEDWGSLIASDGAPPARDPDPAHVALVFGVDVRLSIWRDGRWTAPSPTEP